MKILADCDAERGLLSGLIKYGSISYHEISDLGLTEATFTIDSHNVLFKCLHKIFSSNDESVIPDIPLIYSASSDLGLKSWYQRDEEVSYLNSIINFPVQENNIRIFALKIKKLEIGRRINERLEQAKNDTTQITGNENINEIFSILEKSVIDCGQFLASQDKSASIMGEGLDEYFTDLESHPIDQIGISSGFPLYDRAIGGGFRPGSVNVIASRAKCLEENSVVYTPNGPVKIKDLKIGDKICHPDGKTTNIINIINAGIKDKYIIKFSTGDIVECDENHLWAVKYNNYNKTILKTTKEIKDKGLSWNKSRYKWFVDLTNPVVFITKPTIIDPYLLGILLGDGSITTSTITYTLSKKDIEIVEKLQNTTKYKFSKSYETNTWIRYKIDNINHELKQLKLYGTSSKNKFIPTDYKYNSIETRLWILRGLMDTDGCISQKKKSSIVFNTISKQLAIDIKEIVNSLGGKASIFYFKNKQKNNYYTVTIRLSLNPFFLKRKANKYIGWYKPKHKSIISITKTNQKSNMICITTDSHDGLFLTNNFTITHNCGKSTLALNMATHISSLDIPVLYLDSEMSKEDSWNRMIASLSEISISDIETGQYIKISNDNNKVINARKKLKSLPIYYQSIAGQPLENQIAFIKRWIITEVGLKKNGHAKPCVIIYDYLKLMNENEGKGYQEYQAIGFLMTSLVNFTKKYNFPILSFIQTNRDGISKEDASTIAQSDRVLWFCSSLAIFKPKEQEEIKADGYQFGNRKLVVTDCRYGPGLMPGDYINCHFNKNISKITEGQSKFEVWKQRKPKDTTNNKPDVDQDNDDQNDQIPF